MSSYRLNVKQPKLICLIILSAFAAMGAVLMTPALPSIADYFHVTEGQAQLTVTLFLVGYSVGQLIYGPLANRYGRKPAFYIGITVATLGSLFSILSSPTHSFTLLLVGRLCEALGSSVGLVISFTIISDFYYPEQSRRIISYMMMSFAIVPGVAVFLGGFITQYLNWQSCFYFLLVYGICLIYPAYILPETIVERDHSAMKLARIHRGYMQIFTNLPLIGYGLLYGLTTILPYVFSAEGPFIGIHILGLTAADYGTFALLPTVGMLIGCIVSARLTARVASRQLIYVGAILELIASVLMLGLFLTHHVSMTSLLSLMFFIYMGHAFISGNAPSTALYFAIDKANGSAVMNFTAMSMTVWGTLLLAFIPNKAAYVMPSIFLLSIILIFIIQATLKNNVMQSES